MILADANTEVSALNFGVWMACALLALNGVGTIVGLAKSFRNDSEKREVTLSPEAITRHEFEEARRHRDGEFARLLLALEQHVETNRQEHKDIFSKIGGVERGARAELQAAEERQNQSRAKLHDQDNRILTALGRIEGRLSGQSGGSEI